jgi:hypothetical protein
LDPEEEWYYIHIKEIIKEMEWAGGNFDILRFDLKEEIKKKMKVNWRISLKANKKMNLMRSFLIRDNYLKNLYEKKWKKKTPDLRNAVSKELLEENILLVWGIKKATKKRSVGEMKRIIIKCLGRKECRKAERKGWKAKIQTAQKFKGWKNDRFLQNLITVRLLRNKNL